MAKIVTCSSNTVESGGCIRWAIVRVECGLLARVRQGREEHAWGD